MSDTHNKLQYWNNYNHWKTLDSVLDLHYISFHTLTQRLIQQTFPNTKRRVSVISFLSVFDLLEYYSVQANMAPSQKFRLTPVNVFSNPDPERSFGSHPNSTGSNAGGSALRADFQLWGVCYFFYPSFSTRLSHGPETCSMSPTFSPRSR